MTRSRDTTLGHAHRLVRRASVGILSAFTLALIATLRWQDDRPQRFVVVSAILLVVLSVHVLAARQLTSSESRMAPATLVAGLASAVVVTLVWLLPRLSVPGLPVSGTEALPTLMLGALVAAVLVGLRTRDVAQAAIAALWSTALSSFLVFAGALLAFICVASSVPNTQGRVMLPSATAAQRLAENRIEAPDGYLGLLLVTLMLTAVVFVTVPMARRAASAPVLVQPNARET